jgi:NTE family protein
MSTQDKTIALVLSGGCARGMAHIGVIEALTEQGYTISSLAGTSIGCMIGAIYLSGRLEEFKKWVVKRSKLDVIKLMDFAISKSGLIKGEKVFRQLKKYIPDENIERLPIPYAAVAVDITNHQEVIFREGPLIEAIRASISIPTVFRPSISNGMELVDGGVLNPLPLNVVHRTPGDKLVAVDLNADIAYTPLKSFAPNKGNEKTYEKALEYINEKWSAFFKNGKQKRTGFFDLITHSIYAMQMKLTQEAIKRHNPDIVVSISKNACDIFEFYRAEEMIAYGKKQCISALKELETGP